MRVIKRIINKIMLYSPTKHIYFHNKLDIPIMVDCWIENSNRLHMQRIGSKQKVLLHSSVGEWHLNSIFVDPIDTQIWKESGMNKYRNIGKFRSDPCLSGNYCWIDYPNIFHCEYSEPEENALIRGLITLSLTE